MNKLYEFKQWFRKYKTKKQLFSLLLVCPWIAGFIFLLLIPLGQSLIYSFCTTRSSTTEGLLLTPVGIENYHNVLFVDPVFKINLGNFFRLMFLLVPIIVIFSIIIAVLLNTKMKGRRLLRAVFFLPVILTSGPMLEQLQRIGATRIQGMETFFVFSFIQDLPSVISSPIMYISQRFVYVLWFSGVQILVILSALQKVDGGIYEAAKIDGATSWQSLFFITLPIMRPFILLTTIYTVVDIAGSSLNGMQSQIQSRMFDSASGFGFSAAVSWLYFLLIIMCVLVAWLILRPRKDEKKRRSYR